MAPECSHGGSVSTRDLLDEKATSVTVENKQFARHELNLRYGPPAFKLRFRQTNNKRMIFEIRCPDGWKILAVTNHLGADFSKFFCHTKTIAVIAASPL